MHGGAIEAEQPAFNDQRRQSAKRHNHFGNASDSARAQLRPAGTPAKRRHHSGADSIAGAGIEAAAGAAERGGIDQSKQSVRTKTSDLDCGHQPSSACTADRRRLGHSEQCLRTEAADSECGNSRAADAENERKKAHGQKNHAGHRLFHQ